MKPTENAIARIEKEYANIANWKENAEKAYLERIQKKSCETAIINGVKTPIVHVTTCSEENKLAGMDGINTTVKNNPYCLKRRNAAIAAGDYSCICIYCYAESYNNYIPATEKVGLYNQHILTTKLLTTAEIKAIKIKNENVRFEMFSDVSNEIQARNYIRIAAEFNKNYFAPWSKVHTVWGGAFEKEGGKPDNMTYVLSSVHIDKVDKIPGCIEKYTDYVFTVCSDMQHYEKLRKEYNGVKCAGIRCKECLHCYRRNNAKYVFELKR